MSELLDQHRHVLTRSVEVVAQMRPGQLDVATPCAGWALSDLLAHMIGQHYGFAAAAAATAAAVPDVGEFAPRAIGADAVAEYTASVESVLAAFASPGVLDRTMYLPEIRGGMTFAAPAAIGFHLIDYVVHSWDVARSLGVPVAFDDEALTTALQIARAVPEESKSDTPGAAFAPGVDTRSDATLDRIVALLGRDPQWAP
jgi:uncharacterized protein (TIGR03086 family)